MTMIEWKISKDLVDYQNALDFMENRVNTIINGENPEMVWLLEHPDIYTAGTGAEKADLLIESLLPIFQTGRGGKYTYHGPGQRVIYVMLDLKKRNQCSIRTYINNLSVCIINTLSKFSIKSSFSSERIGVWVDHENNQSKIAAFGIRIRKWVTFHGIAVNIFPDLTKYKGIVPCGLKNYGITSMKDLGVNITLNKFDNILKEEFHKIFPDF